MVHVAFLKHYNEPVKLMLKNVTAVSSNMLPLCDLMLFLIGKETAGAFRPATPFLARHIKALLSCFFVVLVPFMPPFPELGRIPNPLWLLIPGPLPAARLVFTRSQGPSLLPGRCSCHLSVQGCTPACCGSE